MNINLSCPINQLSYGLVSVNILRHLNNPSLFPIGPIQAEEKYHRYIGSALERAKLYDKTAPSLRIYHEFKLDEFVGTGQRIGFSFFEINKLDKIRKHHINNVDKMLVSSKWAKEIIDSQTNTESFVVPLGVDLEVFQPTFKQHGDKTIFLNIGKYEVRKGHDTLPRIFKDAFSNNEAELWMIPTSPHYSEKELSEWGNYYKSILGDDVKFFGHMSEENLVKIINESDVGIFPFKSEAWCLPILEMMACGKKIIATNYSGPTEYLTHDNSYLINIKEMIGVYDAKWFPDSDSTWAYPDSDHMIQLLRDAHNNKNNNSAGIETANKYTWKNTASKIESII